MNAPPKVNASSIIAKAKYKVNLLKSKSVVNSFFVLTCDHCRRLGHTRSNIFDILYPQFPKIMNSKQIYIEKS